MFHIYELYRKTKQTEEMFVCTANLTGDYNEASAEVAIMLINLSANESVERHLYQILSVNESMNTKLVRSFFSSLLLVEFNLALELIN